MSSNIFAYTAPGGNYPEYVSINVDNDKDGNQVTLTVRSQAKSDGSCGDTVSIALTPEQLYKLAYTLFSYACTGNA